MSPQTRKVPLSFAGLILGPALAATLYFILPDHYVNSQGVITELGASGRAAAAAGIWMAVWWMTEAIPIYATALLPLVLFPLAGIASVSAAAAPYGHHLIYLFLGGFIIARSLEKWNLHRRMALLALQHVGTRPSFILAGFMAVTALLSMWVSNTATAMMMLPIALSVISWIESKENSSAVSFAPALLLAVAYAASIGGMGTIIGTPPNLFLVSFLKEHAGIEVSFAGWMGIGLPIVLIFLPIVWFMLTRVLYRLDGPPVSKGKSLCRREYAALGPVSRGEKNTFIVFIITALLWMTRPLINAVSLAGTRPFAGLTDTGIAVLGALSLFIIPVDRKKKIFTMDWPTAAGLPWGVLLLFGGGLSLAAALEANGVSLFLGAKVSGWQGIHGIVVVLLVTALMIYLTELTSNTASTVTFVPILLAASKGLGLHPLSLTVPAALAASCAFMLPVATPPNAIVFGSGRLSMGHMVRAGFWLNIMGIILITLLGYSLVIPVLSQ